MIPTKYQLQSNEFFSSDLYSIPFLFIFKPTPNYFQTRICSSKGNRGYQKETSFGHQGSLTGKKSAHVPAAAARNMKFVLAVHGRNLDAAEKHYSENAENQNT